MRLFSTASSQFTSVGTVEVVRWEQFGLEGTLPFQAMWYSVPAGESSPPDRHPEVEMSVIVSGTADVEAGGRVTRVQQGEAFLLDGEETHVVHNRSPHSLTVFSAYWNAEQVRHG